MRAHVALILLALPGLAYAQSQPSDSGVSWPLPTIGLPLPQIGGPLPRIGLPLPALGLPPVETPGGHANRPSSPPRRMPPADRHRGARSRPSIVYIVPAYGWAEPRRDTAPTEVARSSSSALPSRPTGTLWFDLQPSGIGQIYVDDFFIGTPQDIGGGVTLEAGPHRLEVREPGYQTVGLNVRIEADRAITYRGTLHPLAAAPAAEPEPPATRVAPVARKPFYLIAGCYLGDVPPKEAKLPASCDPSLAVTIWP